MSYTIGGGGGPAGGDTSSDYALDKPYDIYWPLSEDQVQQINEMLDTLFKAQTRAASDISAVSATTSTDIKVVTKILTDSQIQALNTSPITLVSAPGVDKVIVPISWQLRRNTSGGAYSANPTFFLRYGSAGADGSLFSGVAIALNLATDNNWYRDEALETAIVTTDITNNSLVAKTSADVTSGSAGNTLNLIVVYYIHNLAA